MSLVSRKPGTKKPRAGEGAGTGGGEGAEEDMQSLATLERSQLPTATVHP